MGLRRLASGAFTTRHCVSVAELEAMARVAGPAAVANRLLPMDHALSGLSAALLGNRLESQVRSGRALAIPGAGEARDIRLYGATGEMVATAHAVDAGAYQPDRVFTGASGR